MAAAIVLASAAIGANATVLDLTGAELTTAANVSLPNGGAVSGSSLSLPGAAPDSRVVIDIDLSALGFGASGATSGSVAVTNTRLTSDSDLWYGLWDGTSFLSFTSFDGDRSENQSGCGATSNGSTFTFCGGNNTNFITTQDIGDAATALYEFDLVAGTVGFSLNGVVSAGVIGGTFDTNNLSFLVGLGTPTENHQIDGVVIDGVPAQGVPEPATMALIGLGLVGFGALRRRA